MDKEIELSKASVSPSLQLLGTIAGLSPFAMTIVIPLLPMIGLVFDETPARLQYLASAYIFGLVIAQSLVGILSDRVGRRPVLLSGLTLFILSSISLAICVDFEAMVLLRFIQALGVSVCTVVARALARDVFEGEKLLHAFSFMSASIGAAPILAPILGGLVSYFFGYQGVYLLTSFLGLGIFYWSCLSIPKKSISVKGHPITQVDVLRLLKSRRFIGYTGVFGFLQATFLSFISVGAAVFNDYFSIGQIGFGVIWGLMACAYVSGSMSLNHLTRRFGAVKVTQYCVAILLGFGWLGFFIQSQLGINMLSVLIPLTGLMFASGVLTPIAMLGAVEHFPEISGTASGISSSCGLMIGGIFSVISGSLYEWGYMYVAFVIAIATCCIALSWLLVRSSRFT
jgi:MFS family permease